jgi:hypothetical protein
MKKKQPIEYYVYLYIPRTLMKQKLLERSMIIIWGMFWECRNNFKQGRKGLSRKYSLCFKIKVMFGHKLHYKIKVMFGEISLKLRQTNWNVARNNVNVVDNELPSQITIYTCLTIDIWT